MEVCAMQKKLIVAITVLMLMLNCCGKNANTIQVPEEITKGYELADYDIYSLPAKENGKKYEKIYVVGKITEELFENNKDIICAYLLDESNQKWFMQIDSNKSDNNYQELLNKDICVCGIYEGSLEKDGFACLSVNKIYDMAKDETIFSKYYSNYAGEFDENGRVISNDFDKDDNTFIDFHSIQIQIPYNYVEVKYDIYDGDGAFFIAYTKQDMNTILSDYSKKYSFLNKLKEISYLESLYDSLYNNSHVIDVEDITNIEVDTYACKVTHNIDSVSGYGKGTIVLRNDGVYFVILVNKQFSRFNRSQDFSKILESLETLSPARPPRSYGVKKKVVQKENKEEIEDK